MHDLETVQDYLKSVKGYKTRNCTKLYAGPTILSVVGRLGDWVSIGSSG